MKKFLTKLLIYSSPAIIYLLLGEVLLYKYKETVPLNTVVQQQAGSKQELYFFRKCFNTPTALYKRKMVEIKKPDILALGVSISLQFRSLLFYPYENRFYNAGFMVNNLQDFESYIDLLHTNALHKPRLIIFTLDPSWIQHLGFYDFRNNITNPVLDEIKHPNLHVKAVQEAMQFTFNTYPNVRFNGPGFGAPAMQRNGYRRDGSLNNRVQIDTYLAKRHYMDYDYKQHLKNSTFVFAHPLQVDNEKIKSLMHCFEALRAMNIQLIIYFPPIADDFYQYTRHNVSYTRVFSAYLQLQAELQRRRYQVIPFATPGQLGLTDDYMLDAIHPGEVIMSRQFYQYMAGHPEALKTIPGLDLAHLKQVAYQHTLCPLSFNGE